MTFIALVITDLEHGRLGHARSLTDRLGTATVLEHTLRRVARVTQVERIVLVHPEGQEPLTTIDADSFDKPVTVFADAQRLRDTTTDKWVSARKWAMTCWRGGLGQATCYDELLPAGPLVEAMAANDAPSALIVRGEWCFFDPGYAEAQAALHLDAPDAMKLAFTQAPPGLSGLVTGHDLLSQLAEHGASFGSILGYSSRMPVTDPIGREVNHPIPASVRDCDRRFSYDTPRSIAMLKRLATRLGSRLADADAIDVTDAQMAEELEADPAWNCLPQQVTLELSPRRGVAGPITPQGHVTFERMDMDIASAKRLIDQIAEPGDVALTLGGLGDALEHAQWQELVKYAREAGVFGIAVETDLCCIDDDIKALASLPIDLVSIRLDADTEETYTKVRGTEGYGNVIKRVEMLLKNRTRVGLPWIVPRLVKTADTLKDMQVFFERWIRIGAHPVIEPARCGCGSMPAMSPVPMEPPLREPCRQLDRRMTVLSDGRVAQCDQDWFGRGAIGDATCNNLFDIWRSMRDVAAIHREQRFAELTLCGVCTEWHRP